MANFDNSCNSREVTRDYSVRLNRGKYTLQTRTLRQLLACMSELFLLEGNIGSENRGS